jgi:hypothetical protein
MYSFPAEEEAKVLNSPCLALHRILASEKSFGETCGVAWNAACLNVYWDETVVAR